MQLSLQDSRKVLFTPCASREHFKAWLKNYLGLDLPDCTVSDESTTNPLDAAWQYYDRIIRNDLEEQARVMTYAGRGGFKTLSAAALETMVLLHTKRNVGHMAAVDAQSQKSAAYVKDFFEKPLLRDFKVGDNARGVKIVRYTHKRTGEILTDAEFRVVPAAEKIEFERRENYLKIIICTLAGSQSEHVEFFVVDEIDVVPPQNVRAYHLAQNIPDPRDGMLPLTLLTSTRKSQIGLVQQEIETADDTGLVVHHWNLIDVTQKCEPERHKPFEPKQTYYVNDDLVKHITVSEFETIPDVKKSKWYAIEGYAGCRKCRLFPGCKGRLATEQKSTSPMLKPISFGIGKFTQFGKTPDFITTEYLCRKPDTSGLMYPRLDKDRQMVSARVMADLINGEENSTRKIKVFGKTELIKLLQSKAARFYTGIDWGFTHNFVIVTIAVFGPWCFVLDCFSQAGLELEDKLAAADFLKTIYLGPAIYADPEDPSSIKTFRRKGFKMKEWQKTPGSVKAGIEVVRSVILNSKGESRLLFLADDDGVDFLFTRLAKYKRKFDAAGNPTEDPDETDDDECDATRYVIMNVFSNKGALKGDTSTHVTTSPSNTIMKRADMVPKNTTGQQQWMKDLVAEKLGTGGSAAPTVPAKTVRKGRFFFSG